MLARIFGNTFYTLHVDRAFGIVVLVRSDVPYPAIADLKACFDDIDKALESLDRSKSVLVFDVRKGPLRNDPVFESVSNDRRRRIQRGFARRCVLVASKIGMVQIERHAALDPFPVEVFDDPDAMAAALGVRGRFKF